MIDMKHLKARGAQFDYQADRRLRQARLTGEGLMAQELRHKRELRKRDRAIAALHVWAAVLAALWLVTCLAGVKVLARDRALSQAVAQQKEQIANMGLVGGAK